MLNKTRNVHYYIKFDHLSCWFLRNWLFIPDPPVVSLTLSGKGQKSHWRPVMVNIWQPKRTGNWRLLWTLQVCVWMANYNFCRACVNEEHHTNLSHVQYVVAGVVLFNRWAGGVCVEAHQQAIDSAAWGARLYWLPQTRNWNTWFQPLILWCLPVRVQQQCLQPQRWVIVLLQFMKIY